MRAVAGTVPCLARVGLAGRGQRQRVAMALDWLGQADELIHTGVPVSLVGPDVGINLDLHVPRQD